MSTEVVMPQMGESIAEGTITKWLKKVGERVERDEPLFEISTDKVDAEIPSPAAGTLTEIRFKEGDTVEVNTVVAVLDGDGAGPSQKSPSPQPAAAEPPPPPVETKPEPPPPPAPAPAPAPPPPPATPAAKSAEPTVEELRRTKSSPLVRKIAQEHNVDISKLEGTGLSGRVTKNDILSYIESGSPATAPAAPPPAAPQRATAPAAAPSAPAPSMPAELPAPPPPRPQMGDRVEPMSVMRKKIAEHMVLSRRTSAHVTTVYEIDMTRIAKLREQHRDSFYERTGTKLTFMPFIFEAVIKGLRKFPIFNAQVSGEQLIYKQDINLGMAVALDWGLIVPVIKRADDLSISGLARAANDLA
ncbi:MAG TPA: dihydrolipoamide acetyltransferase family protein, partial [Pyrinomonadaceae bacterium]